MCAYSSSIENNQNAVCFKGICFLKNESFMIYSPSCFLWLSIVCGVLKEKIAKVSLVLYANKFTINKDAKAPLKYLRSK